MISLLMTLMIFLISAKAVYKLFTSVLPFISLLTHRFIFLLNSILLSDYYIIQRFMIE